MDYIAAHIRIEPFSEEMAEIVMAEVGDLGFDSFTVEDPCLNAFIAKDSFSAANLKTVLSAFSSPEFHVTFTTEYIREQNWNAVWESDFEPVVVEGEVTVRATYHKDLPKTKYNIVIDPKMSFGSGHHQTTCLMISSLLSHRRQLKGRDLLDMGCGTGILSIAAAKMGAGVPVHAVDIDPVCVRSAKDNARRNRVAHKIITLCGDASVLQAGRYDFLLANINRNILVEDMSTYARALRPGGIIFMSGFYTGDIPIIADAAARQGLEMVSSEEKDDWAVVKCIKKG